MRHAPLTTNMPWSSSAGPLRRVGFGTEPFCTWVKIKNREYSHREGRRERFEQRRDRRQGPGERVSFRCWLERDQTRFNRAAFT